jgi:hypothetical protein
MTQLYVDLNLDPSPPFEKIKIVCPPYPQCTVYNEIFFQLGRGPSFYCSLCSFSVCNPKYKFLSDSCMTDFSKSFNQFTTPLKDNVEHIFTDRLLETINF